MRYAVVIEKANRTIGLRAGPARLRRHGRDCRSRGAPHRDAIRFHIEGLKAEGLEVPDATSIADYVEA